MQVHTYIHTYISLQDDKYVKQIEEREKERTCISTLLCSLYFCHHLYAFLSLTYTHTHTHTHTHVLTFASMHKLTWVHAYHIHLRDLKKLPRHEKTTTHDIAVIFLPWRTSMLEFVLFWNHNSWCLRYLIKVQY